MRVLITGGAGYVGSHCAKLLAQTGHQVVVLDNLSTGRREAARWGQFVRGDLADRQAVTQVLKHNGVEAVMHFAASTHVPESVRNPQKYFSNNVISTLNLLDGMLEAGIETIVFSSSCAVYGVPEAVPISEEQARRPVSPYGESKLFAERALEWYGVAYGLRWVSLRYFNAAGADPDGEIGEAHEPETHLIPRAILTALGRSPFLDVYGTNHSTPDGTAVRDYVHVVDLARAHLLALEYMCDGGGRAALNLGCGKGYSVREVISAVERTGGRHVPVREAPRREGDPASLVADARKAVEVLGWRSELSDLDNLVRTAWRWHECSPALDRTQPWARFLRSPQHWQKLEPKSGPG